MLETDTIDRLASLGAPNSYVRSWRRMAAKGTNKSWNWAAASVGVAWLETRGLHGYAALYLPTHILYVAYTFNLYYICALINLLILIRYIKLGRDANFIVYRNLSTDIEGKSDEDVAAAVRKIFGAPAKID